VILQTHTTAFGFYFTSLFSHQQSKVGRLDPLKVSQRTYGNCWRENYNKLDVLPVIQPLFSKV